MRKAIVAGNWKMHGSKAFVADYAAALIVALQEIAVPDAVAVVLFPPPRRRVLIRPSGTEPVVRVMVEGEELELVSSIATELADVVRT